MSTNSHVWHIAWVLREEDGYADGTWCICDKGAEHDVLPEA